MEPNLVKNSFTGDFWAKGEMSLSVTFFFWGTCRHQIPGWILMPIMAQKHARMSFLC